MSRHLNRSVKPSNLPYIGRLASGHKVHARLVTRTDRKGRQTIALRAKRVPGGASHVRPNPDSQRIAALLLEAHDAVARCKNTACARWFARTTAKQEYCTLRCSDRRRAWRHRRRRGVAIARRKPPRLVQCPPRSARGALTHADWQDLKKRAA
jgi:hypothetical protein